jgi:tetratricopeptide (TPR) repeat protein
VRLRRVGLVPLLLAAVVWLSTATPAFGHGDEEMPASEEAEVAELAEQPARILAQQALALLAVRDDAEEAAIRLDAALESQDQDDIDADLLAEATETLDGGDPEGALPLLDEALSRPLGSERGEALHEAGRELSPGSCGEELAAIIAGVVFLLIGGAALARHRPS